MANTATKVGNIRGPAISYFAAVFTAASDGTLTVTFPTGLFSSPPIVQATGVATDGRDVVVTLTADPTATQCKFLVRKSRLLPASLGTLLALQGYDTFVPGAFKIHVTAFPAS